MKEDERADEDEIAGEDDDERSGRGRIQMDTTIKMKWIDR